MFFTKIVMSDFDKHDDVHGVGQTVILFLAVILIKKKHLKIMTIKLIIMRMMMKMMAMLVLRKMINEEGEHEKKIQ